LFQRRFRFGLAQRAHRIHPKPLVEALRVEAVRATELFAHFFRSKVFFKLAQTDSAHFFFAFLPFVVVIDLLMNLLAMSFSTREVPSHHVVLSNSLLCKGGRFAVWHLGKFFDDGFSFETPTDSNFCQSFHCHHAPFSCSRFVNNHAKYDAQH